jgi:hypothetical protein
LTAAYPEIRMVYIVWIENCTVNLFIGQLCPQAASMSLPTGFLLKPGIYTNAVPGIP